MTRQCQKRVTGLPEKIRFSIKKLQLVFQLTGNKPFEYLFFLKKKFQRSAV